jgi:hydroxyacylglutathione hydrolase
MSSALHALPVLQDNVIWIWEDGDQAVVVDPAVAAPVRQWLLDRELTLLAILQTHHHADHIGGTPDLLHTWPDADVIAAAADRARIPFQTRSVADGDEVDLMGHTLQVMDVAAHTAAHIAFYLADQSIGPVVFCGDTLFAGGCGRLFEGSAEQMHSAMQRFALLPESTKVCCAHEYTEGNLRWAAELRPDDQSIAARHREVKRLRSVGSLTLPSSIGAERRTNLFMRAQTAQELAELRHHKDHWRPT